MSYVRSSQVSVWIMDLHLPNGTIYTDRTKGEIDKLIDLAKVSGQLKPKEHCKIIFTGKYRGRLDGILYNAFSNRDIQTMSDVEILRVSSPRDRD